MGYSIYPKLRAIYSFLPTPADIESLLMAKGISEFRNRFQRTAFYERFSPVDEDFESFLRRIPFSLAILVGRQIPGMSALFFDAYINGYELSDIKDIVNGGKGFFVDGLRDKSFEMEELNNYMQKGIWKVTWNLAFARYKERHNKVDIEVALDRYYYSYFLQETQNLPYGEAIESREFIITLINFKNKLWLYRLKKFYNLQDFEIKRFLIPEGEVYESLSEEEGIHEDLFIKEFSDMCYKDFKFRMYSMRAILAFFFFLTSKIEEILSIYRGKSLVLDNERLRDIWEKLYVGS